MSHCLCFTWPAHTKLLGDGTTIGIPAGTVGVFRPNPQLVSALLLPAKSDAQSAAARIGVMPLLNTLWEQMTARTEAEASRVIFEREFPRICASRNVHPAAVTNLSQHDAIGLLIPEPDKMTRRFRGAWRQSGPTMPFVDMPLARTQRMNEIRAERTPRLEKSDVDLLRAQETADVVTQNNLKTYRQKLRDVPQVGQPNVDAITTPEALAAWEPTWPVSP